MPADKQAEGEAAVLAAIADMPEPDQTIGRKLHDIITANAPGATPRTWYGMPAYSRGDKVVCFFRSTKKFHERYMTLGFNDSAQLDDGSLWPITYALQELTDENALKIRDIVRKAFA